MPLVIALLLLTVGAVAFHLLSPWWLTPLASNWRQMDEALQLTLALSGLAFVAINLFLAYAIWRFRHRDGVRASAEHGNARLEWWLLGLTSVGIAALLAPGLAVYAELIHPPADALLFEVVGQQWRWSYRFPGADGKLGRTDPRFVGADNLFGIDPADPNGSDDLLVAGGEVHLPAGRPVKFLLRAQDAVHDFFVPPFRTRMNMVPGMVTSFWLTPQRSGRFEVLCAQLCGIGHAAMRGYVVVEQPAAFGAWLAALPTFAATPGGAAGRAAQGRLLAQARGCVACHSVDGSAGAGPSWKGLYRRREPLEGGGSALADEAYLRESISAPKAKTVRGFAPIMPQQDFGEADLAALVAYIESLGGGAGPAAGKGGGDGIRQ
ncbi:cytochrome c oxidase subunit II [Rugamonas sp. DEMB1]|uniref:cytochrome c oxidase subunit II n=1 Tax=Rugamonas sp. DEMB1 TaxID=3039386 RepID=UPI002446C7BA|nr:cytochrome c oxidase subunit II [Rugamonas sp. DEMB1]WGG48211.1 cytochrome c oxidase subunit II [Rugamonas sp. DEMB1]